MYEEREVACLVSCFYLALKDGAGKRQSKVSSQMYVKEGGKVIQFKSCFEITKVMWNKVKWNKAKSQYIQ